LYSIKFNISQKRAFEKEFSFNFIIIIDNCSKKFCFITEKLLKM
jgi:hypothetical protein